jgi:molecular chaperone DnaK
MVKDAEAHASDDMTRRDAIEKKNNLDSMVYQAEKTLAENGEKLDDAQKKGVEDAIADARKDLESEDATRIDAGLQRLEGELHKVAEALYKTDAAQGDGSGAAGAADAGADADDDVIDAEYTEAKSDEDQASGSSKEN